MRSTAPSRSFIAALGGERLPYADHPYRNRADIPQHERIVETDWIIPGGAILDAVRASRGDSRAARLQRRALVRGLRRIRTSAKNIPAALVPEKRYLWVLDRRGLHFLPELVFYREPDGAPPGDGTKPHLRMKHTNITGGGRALLGGEAWFDARNLHKVYLNAKSGRYGRLGAFKDRVFAFIRELGFLVVDVGDLR